MDWVQGIRNTVGEFAFLAIQQLPDFLARFVINAHPADVTVRQSNGNWIAEGGGYGPITLTKPQDGARLLVGPGGVGGRIQQLADHYQNPESGVVVESGDFVVDIGACIGEASLAFLDADAAKVIALEPDPRNYDALTKTARQISELNVQHLAAWHTTGEKVTLQLTDDTSESGVLDPDSGRVVGSVDVETITVSDFAPIDFLKVEAEGNEPEVLDGLKAGDVRKVVVNCDPERDGESPKEIVVEKLESLGYNVVVRRDTVFGIME